MKGRCIMDSSYDPIYGQPPAKSLKEEHMAVE